MKPKYVFIILIVLLGGWYLFSQKTVLKVKTVQNSQISVINVDATSIEVRVEKSNDDKINVHFQGKESDENNLEVNEHGDILNVSYRNEKISFINLNLLPDQERKLTVFLPEKQYNELKVKVGSGEMTIDHFKGKKIDANSGSGKITMKDIETENSVVHANSGG